MSRSVKHRKDLNPIVADLINDLVGKAFCLGTNEHFVDGRVSDAASRLLLVLQVSKNLESFCFGEFW